MLYRIDRKIKPLRSCLNGEGLSNTSCATRKLDRKQQKDLSNALQKDVEPTALPIDHIVEWHRWNQS
jgi:hypothetical protein